MPMTRLALALFCFALCSPSYAGDLYRVEVQSHRDAEVLESSGAEALLRIEGGYLTILEDEIAARLAAADIKSEPVATDVSRDRMAIDMRADGSNIDRYPLLYQEEGLRLYRIEPSQLRAGDGPTGLAPILTDSRRFVFVEPATLDRELLRETMDLEQLIGLVRQDSLESYSHTLEAFYRRVTGTVGAYTSRNWLLDKFAEFGYDSLGLDSFVATIDDWPTKCHNVLACKIGSEYPEHHIVIGAHRDAVPGSPGADDNGSGTCAVLEIARVLRDVDTRFTIVFLLFDAEEWGLHGSWNYANNAGVRGDSIVVMLNMDMIAHYESNNLARVLRGGGDTTYSALWRDLADSLPSIGISASLGVAGGGSDHYPFYQNGYPAIFSHEGVFSTVYHSPQDSTSYMDFDYFTRMTRATLATAYVVDQTRDVSPMLAFDFAGGPETILPGEPTPLTFSVAEYAGGVLEPGSVWLHYRADDSAWDSLPAGTAGGGAYETALPAQERLSLVQYYFSAREVSHGTFYHPQPGQTLHTVAATGSQVIFEDDFMTDLGWTVSGDASAGHWIRCAPKTQIWGAPGRDYDGNSFCYVTGEPDGRDVDNGATTLTSPMLDLSGGRPVVEYARWFSNSTGAAPKNDVMRIFISNDNGQSWTTVEDIGPIDESSGGWYRRTFVVGDLIEPTSLMRLRFDASDYGGDSQVEAGVDAVRVRAYSCYPIVVTDALPDWTAGQSYSQQLTAAGGAGEYVWSDKHGDLVGSGLALSADGLVSGVPTTAGEVAFTAMVADSVGDTDERPLSIAVNTALEIATDTLPGAHWEMGYLCQLSHSGGTGDIVWSDRDGDLLGTGMALSAAGLLNGTPTDAGTVTFVARAEDETGAADERELSLDISFYYICADIDGSQTDPDIADLVYLVNFMFQGGPPPPIMSAANVDGAGDPPVDIADLVYFVNYMFQGGPAPNCP